MPKWLDLANGEERAIKAHTNVIINSMRIWGRVILNNDKDVYGEGWSGGNGRHLKILRGKNWPFWTKHWVIQGLKGFRWIFAREMMGKWGNPSYNRIGCIAPLRLTGLCYKWAVLSLWWDSGTSMAKVHDFGKGTCVVRFVALFRHRSWQQNYTAATIHSP